METANRSPGAAPRAFGTPVEPGGLLIVKNASEEGVFPGQLATVLDSSGGDQCTVSLVTGERAGQELELLKRHLEPYSGMYCTYLSRHIVT